MKHFAALVVMMISAPALAGTEHTPATKPVFIHFEIGTHWSVVGERSRKAGVGDKALALFRNVQSTDPHVLAEVNAGGKTAMMLVDAQGKLNKPASLLTDRETHFVSAPGK